MRLHILSDLHLEFEPFTPPVVEADAVILAGDVSTGRNGLKWALTTFPDRPVIYVLGNHEFYGQKLILFIGFKVEELAMSQDNKALDSNQSASAAQFNRQSDCYGKSHILADTQDVEQGLRGVSACPGGTALDVATGGGHTALWLARHGWKVTAGDIAPRMLENAQNLCAQAGFGIETSLFPAEEMPFADGSFDLVTVRVAPHHFSSPAKFIRETARVLKPGGHFLLIDGSVPDDDPETEDWLHRVEKWRDPSHGRFLSRKAWEDLAREAGLKVVRSELHTRKQPDLEWYFETAATPRGNREQVLEAIAKASKHVKAVLRLGHEGGKIVWWWPMLTLLASKD